MGKRIPMHIYHSIRIQSHKVTRVAFPATQLPLSDLPQAIQQFTSKWDRHLDGVSAGFCPVVTYDMCKDKLSFDVIKKSHFSAILSSKLLPPWLFEALTTGLIVNKSIESSVEQFVSESH